MKPMVPHTDRAPHPWDVGGEPQEVFGGRQHHQAGGDAHGHPATGVASTDPKEGRPARPIQWPEPWSRHSLELFPTPKRSAKAKARVVAEEREKDATREGRPLVQPMRRITSMAIRWRSSKWSAISASRPTSRALTSVSHALNGWLHGGRIATEVCRMEIVAKKTNKVFSLDKIDFEKQPRSQRVSDRTRADLRRAGRSNFGNLKDAAQTHAGRYGKMGFVSIRFRIEWNVILTILSTTPWHRSPQTVANSWKSWPSACRPTWADHEKRGESNWEQVSAQGWSSCRTRNETSLSPWTWRRKSWLRTMPGFSPCLSLQCWPRSSWKRGGNPRRCCMVGLAQCYPSIKRHRKTVSLTSSTLQDANGTNSTTMSKVKNTLLKRPQPLSATDFPTGCWMLEV